VLLVLVPVIVGLCVLAFAGSFVVDRVRRRKRTDRLAQLAEQGLQAGSSTAIATSEIRAIEHGAGLPNSSGGGWGASSR
jgi:hypothetical protein